MNNTGKPLPLLLQDMKAQLNALHARLDKLTQQQGIRRFDFEGENILSTDDVKGSSTTLQPQPCSSTWSFSDAAQRQTSPCPAWKLHPVHQPRTRHYFQDHHRLALQQFQRKTSSSDSKIPGSVVPMEGKEGNYGEWTNLRPRRHSFPAASTTIRPRSAPLSPVSRAATEQNKEYLRRGSSPCPLSMVPANYLAATEPSPMMKRALRNIIIKKKQNNNNNNPNPNHQERVGATDTRIVQDAPHNTLPSAESVSLPMSPPFKTGSKAQQEKSLRQKLHFKVVSKE